MQAALSVLPLSRVPAIRAVSISSSLRVRAGLSTTTSAPTSHVTFIREVAGLQQQQPLLDSLFGVLEAKGEIACSPYEKRNGLFPLAIPLAENLSDGSLTALLRWPTAPEGMDVPVVTVRKHGVTLLAKNMSDYIHRALVEEDASSNGQEERVYSMAGDSGRALYNRGEFQASKMGSLDAYLLKKVGKFPDVVERLALNHLARGDEISALVTGEFYSSKLLFPGFGRPFVFSAQLLLKVGRKLEARDAARSGLKSPWWTLGCSYSEVAQIAGWGDEQVEFMRERVSEEGRREDLLKGKTEGQAALDQAAFLLDLAAVDGQWDDIREQLAAFYKEAQMEDVSRFVLPSSW